MTTTIILSDTLAESLLDRAVAEFGADHVYEGPPGAARLDSCYYVKHNRQLNIVQPMCPACIIGYVLHWAGLPLDVLAKFEGQRASALLKKLAGPNASDYIIEASSYARGLLDLAQSFQDTGHSWGEAVHHARAAITPLKRAAK